MLGYDGQLARKSSLSRPLTSWDDIRNHDWVTSHLRTWRAFLYRAINPAVLAFQSPARQVLPVNHTEPCRDTIFVALRRSRYRRRQAARRESENQRQQRALASRQVHERLPGKSPTHEPQAHLAGGRQVTARTQDIAESQQRAVPNVRRSHQQCTPGEPRLPAAGRKSRVTDRRKLRSEAFAMPVRGDIEQFQGSGSRFERPGLDRMGIARSQYLRPQSRSNRRADLLAQERSEMLDDLPGIPAVQNPTR
jgi:hypothetical protein